ncbi:monovalent cation/H(+) antiporter subunit G [Salinimonas sp. HHU 13199]|uniref:Monovalent cation/H(+) antiporter subunit G n=2 Tax=Salinimonas profundi TaxID=2729140 RepID=A0ABR8LKW3_9ALTE|nr:monovalent cation/H(+) antiporter subunit G [Salinimonas profundi]
MILNSFTVAFLLAGLFFFVSGSIALLRFPSSLSRLHALTKADNLGLGLIALGVLFQTYSLLQAVQILLIWGLVTFSGAAGAFFIARKHYKDIIK